MQVSGLLKLVGFSSMYICMKDSCYRWRMVGCFMMGGGETGVSMDRGGSVGQGRARLQEEGRSYK